MTPQKRQQKILALLERHEEMEVAKIASRLSASDMTVRRDLNRMAEDGLIIRTHGGAMKAGTLVNKKAFEHKIAVNLDAKDAICRLAAREIHDGDTIFMDCGSTVFRLCQFIRNKTVKVITNSLPVVAELLSSTVRVNLIGGEVDAERQAVHGLIAEEHIGRYTAAKAFLGVDGLSAEGLFAHSELEASITQAFAQRAQETFLLCDAGKVDKQAYLKFGELSMVHTVVTDREVPGLAAIRQKGVRVLVPA